MRSPYRSLAAALLVCAPALVAPAEEGAWHASLDAALDAAKKSGRPVLVVTLWPKGL